MKRYLLFLMCIIASTMHATHIDKPLTKEQKKVAELQKKMWDMASENKLEMLKKVFAQKVKLTINEQNSEGDTVLAVAIYHNNPEMVRFLIQQGADVNIANKAGKTPLMQAIIGNKDEQIIKQLIAADAHLNVKDHDGYTALMHAVNFMHTRKNDPTIIRLLVEAGADDTIKINKATAIDLAFPLQKASVQDAINSGKKVFQARKEAVQEHLIPDVASLVIDYTRS